MNVFAGRPAFLSFNTDDSHAPWDHSSSTSPLLVQIAIEHPHVFRGKVILDHIPLQPLKDVAPALLQYLTIDGTRIIFPCSSAIDKDVLLDLICSIADQHRASVAFDLDLSLLPQEPVALIKLHVILELFELDALAQDLLSRLWGVLESHSLSPADVFWIWGAFGPYQDGKWTAKSAGDYMQMMAWNILNANIEGELASDAKKILLEMEGEPRHLRQLLEERFLKYGLGRELRSTVEGASKKQRNTATSHTSPTDGFLTSFYEPSRNPPCRPTSPSFVAPFFPFVSAGSSDPLDTTTPSSPEPFPSPPKSTDPAQCTPQHGGIEALDSHGKWDGKEKKVKKMAAERDRLVCLRRMEAIDKSG